MNKFSFSVNPLNALKCKIDGGLNINAMVESMFGFPMTDSKVSSTGVPNNLSTQFELEHIKLVQPLELKKSMSLVRILQRRGKLSFEIRLVGFSSI